MRLLFIGFGVKLLVDAQALPADAALEEAQEAEEAVLAADRQLRSSRPPASRQVTWSHMRRPSG